MRIDAGQQMRIDQRMKLAPRMIQSMEILQMPSQQLEERIEQELVSNPTLELREAGANARELEAEREQSQRDATEGERELKIDATDGGSADDFERLNNISDEYRETWSDNAYETSDIPSGYRVVRDNGERDAKLDAMANTAARSACLADQLRAQWLLAEVDPELQRVGEHVIGFLDADGYLRTDPQQMLVQAPRGVTMEQIEQAIAALQRTLDPPGLGARDLRECLLLQIDAREEQEPDVDLSVERTLVADHLKDIENNRLPRIAKETGLSLDQIKRAITSLRQFHPHPGRLLVEDSPQVIRPDVIVEYDEGEDRYLPRLAGDRLPAVHINRKYVDMARDQRTDRKTRDFVGANLRSARWLLDAIEQRKHTLLRVVSVVLEAQRDFFDLGPQHLKALPMTQVAEQLGIHVATVSRAVSEKYIQTPRGILPLRMFFSGGAETEAGESMSWSAIQARIKQIIDEEDKSAPLSDDQIVARLHDEGIELARRTVAKYRKQMHIPTARQRREY